MNYLIDTNILSELIKPIKEPLVLEWFNKIPNEAMYVSALTFGEIRKGVENLKDQKRKEKIKIWLEVELSEWFENRILAIDRLVAERWGRLLAQSSRTIPAIDSLIAATALHYDLTLVTRNEKDFKFSNLEVFNPWRKAQ